MSTHALIGHEHPGGVIYAFEIWYNGNPDYMMNVLEFVTPAQVNWVITQYGFIISEIGFTDSFEQRDKEKFFGEAQKRFNKLRSEHKKLRVKLNDKISIVKLDKVDTKENKDIRHEFKNLDEYINAIGNYSTQYHYLFRNGKWEYYDREYTRQSYYLLSLKNTSLKDAWISLLKIDDEPTWYEEKSAIYIKRFLPKFKESDYPGIIPIKKEDMEDLFKLVVYENQFHHVLPNTEKVREKLKITKDMFGKKMTYTTPVEGFCYIK